MQRKEKERKEKSLGRKYTKRNSEPIYREGVKVRLKMEIKGV